MTATSTSPHNSRFAHSTRRAISHLGPSSDAHSSHHIKVVVVLVWPYSSSTRALSLLLAEPDVRLRKGRGQVKATFYGPSAEAVAKSQVGIGDTVKLGLEGAHWVPSTEDVSTPGMKIEWDLVFDGKANLDVKRDSHLLASISVDHPVQLSAAISPPTTQPVEASLNGTGSSQHLRDINSWASPVFVRGKKLSSGSFLDASLDLFANDDDFVVGKGRKRTKFARHSDSWQLLDRTPSPENETVDLQLDSFEEPVETTALDIPPQTVSNDHDDVEIPEERPRPAERGQLEFTTGSLTAPPGEIPPPSNLPESPPPGQAGTETSSSSQLIHATVHETGYMKPPAMRPPKLPGVSDTVSNSVAGHEIELPPRSNLETPRLGPVPSPGLPLVSPLITRSDLSTSYFPDYGNIRSELDATGERQRLVSLSDPKSAPNSQSTPSPEVGQFPLHSSIESNMTHMLEPGATVGDMLFETSSPALDVSQQFDPAFQPTSWPSSYQEIQQPHDAPFEQQQTSVGAKGSDFEFLNTSPVEPYSGGQRTWSNVEAAAGTMATLQPPSGGGPLDSNDATVPPSSGSREDSHKTSQYNSQSLSNTHEAVTSDSTATHVGESTHIEIDIAVSRGPVDSSQKAPIDPNLLESLGAGATLLTSDTEKEGVTKELPEQLNEPRRWGDKLVVSVIDAESQQVYAPSPFPFQQRRTSSQRRRRSSKQLLLDGASDEVSTDESSDVEDMSDSSHRLDTSDHEDRRGDRIEIGRDSTAFTPAPSMLQDSGSRDQGIQISATDKDLSITHVPDGPQSVVVLDSSDEDDIIRERPEATVNHTTIISGASPSEEKTDFEPGKVFDSGNKKQLGTNEIIDFSTDHIEDPVRQTDPAYVEPSSAASDTAARNRIEGDQVEKLPIRRHDEVGEFARPPTEPTQPPQQLDEVLDQKLRYQLFTPDSTQQGKGDSQQQDHTDGLDREISLPPTPQNTQQHADIAKPTVEPPMSPNAETELSQTSRLSLESSVDDLRGRRRSPRLSRKFPPSHEVTEVVSPYFSPRRSRQLRAQDQLAMPHKPTVVERSQVAAKDTTETAETENKLNVVGFVDEGVGPRSPLPTQPKAGLTTSLSYYTPLSLLQDHFAHSVDIIALSTTESTEPEKAKSGPRDWHTTVHLTDASLQGNKTITAQFFRPYKTALPSVQRGNVVLLRNFKVQNQKRKCMLLSTDSSAWAVFSVRRERKVGEFDISAMIAGPPVEYGQEEKDRVLELDKWWEVEGQDQHPTQKPANRTGKAVLAKNDDDGSTNYELRQGTVYRDDGDSDKQTGNSMNYHELRDGNVYHDNTVDKTSGSDRKSSDSGGKRADHNTFHELRDGTVYQGSTPSRAPRDGKNNGAGGAVIRRVSSHEDDVAATQETGDGKNVEDDGQEVEYVDGDVEAEADSGEESPTDEEISLQLYHELRNGRRYVDPAPAQRHSGEPQRPDGESEDESVIHELRDGVTYTD